MVSITITHFEWYVTSLPISKVAIDGPSQHIVSHKSRKLECWACYKKFRTISHILLHLESGSCPSGWTEERVRAEAIKLDGPWRNEDRASELFILCPTCDRGFHLVSGFLQHIESPSCGEEWWSVRGCAIGLLRQLRRNMKLDMQTVFGVSI
jgi:uncharacterized C2H2 Zn-finger protein